LDELRSVLKGIISKTEEDNEPKEEEEERTEYIDENEEKIAGPEEAAAEEGTSIRNGQPEKKIWGR